MVLLRPPPAPRRNGGHSLFLLSAAGAAMQISGSPPQKPIVLRHLVLAKLFCERLDVLPDEICAGNRWWQIRLRPEKRSLLGGVGQGGAPFRRPYAASRSSLTITPSKNPGSSFFAYSFFAFASRRVICGRRKGLSPRSLSSPAAAHAGSASQINSFGEPPTAGGRESGRQQSPGSGQVSLGTRCEGAWRRSQARAFSSVSVPLPRSLFSSSSREGGEMKTKTASSFERLQLSAPCGAARGWVARQPTRRAVPPPSRPPARRPPAAALPRQSPPPRACTSMSRMQIFPWLFTASSAAKLVP